MRPWLTRRATSAISGAKGAVAPFALGFDGPLTVAANLFGADFFLLLGEDPEKAVEVMLHLTRAIVTRNHALAARNGQPLQGDWGWLADDSIQLISTGMYEEYILPIHEFAYRSFSTTTPADHRRFMHLCGDSTRHFPMIHERLGVVSFDTGFPVDHGRLREQLGEEVEISGGPRVDLLQYGTAGAMLRLRARHPALRHHARRALHPAGSQQPAPQRAAGEFSAVYEACLEFGWYTHP